MTAIYDRGYFALVPEKEAGMDRKWHDWLIEKTSFSESNLFVVVGSLITLVSLIMPWFKKVYVLSYSTVSPGELLAGYLFSGAPLPWHTLAAVTWILALSIVATFVKKRLAAFMALIAFGLLGTSLYLNTVPLERFTWGLVVTASGLAVMLLGFIGKEA